MYSGITRGLFEVIQVDKKPGLISYTVKLNSELIKGLEVGASVAIDGVCQTVVNINKDEASFQAIAETLKCTTLNDLFVGRKVSVENSLRFGDVNGGHEMAGHVIGTAEVCNIRASENNLNVVLQCPQDWMKYILTKGFIGVDGSSLTVGEVNYEQGSFEINLIPETLRVTNFSKRNIGDKVNIELDFKTQAIVHTVERVLQQSYPQLEKLLMSS